jgi:hypothetical protein
MYLGFFSMVVSRDDGAGSGVLRLHHLATRGTELVFGVGEHHGGTG